MFAVLTTYHQSLTTNNGISMSHYVAFIGLIILTFFWRNLAPISLRRVAVPWAFAILLMNVACGSFYWGPVRSLYVIMNYSAFVIMLDGFDTGSKRNNPAWTAFIVFWGYMVFSSLYGYYKSAAIFYWTNIFLTTFCCGYFAARWVARTENGLGKLLFAMSCVSCVSMFLYAKHGGISAVEVGSTGRAGLDSETLAEGVVSNVNFTALVMLTFIPFLVVGLLRSARTRSDKIAKRLSLVALILCGLALVRTGARNGAVGLLPSVWYFLFSATNRIKLRKRIGLFIAITVIFLPLVFYMMKGAETIRFFNFSAQQEGFTGDKGDIITSGRISMWKRNLEEMSAIQILIGRGMSIYSLAEDVNERRAGRLTAGNAHSMIITILCNSGVMGLILFFVFVSVFVKRGMRMGDRGRLALLFVGTWMLSGVAESWGMIGGASAQLCGFGIGLLSHRVATNSEFNERVGFAPIYIG